MKTDSAERNLYWGRYGYADQATFRIRRPGGREIWEDLGRLSRDVARVIVRTKRRELMDRWALEAAGLVAAPPPAPTSSFGDLFAAYDGWAAGASIGVHTVKSNKQALARLVREAGGPADSDALAAASLEVLKSSLVTDYEAARVHAAKDEAAQGKLSKEQTERLVERAQTTAYSTVHQARSLFAKRPLASANYRRLQLPAGLTTFMSQPVDGHTLRDYDPLPAAAIQAVFAGVKALKATEPALWLAAKLILCTDQRRSTCVHARWDWFRDEGRADPASGRSVVAFVVGVAKGNRPIVAVDREDYEEMLAARIDAGPYVLGGAEAVGEGDAGVKARDAIYAKLCLRLRELGLRSRRQPNHELRKIYTDAMLAEHGEDAAMAATGHSTARLLRAYSQRRGKHALRLG